MDASTTRTADVNAAMFCDFADAGFLAAALVPYVHGQGPALVSDDAKLLRSDAYLDLLAHRVARGLVRYRDELPSRVARVGGVGR